jgi:uncharacterized protein YkwD
MLRFTARLLLAFCCALALSRPALAQTDLNDPDQFRQAQDYMLLRINNERARNGAGSVRLEPLASETARLHAQDMLDKGYVSHWDMEGVKPTRRWNLQGGFDCVAENIYMREGELGDLRAIVDDAMETLLASEGHRRTILDPEYNRVGLGFSFDAGREQVYVVQEFLTRIGGEYACPLFAQPGATVELQGRIDPQVHRLEQVILGWEELPQKRNKQWLARTGEYKEADRLVAGYSPNPAFQFKSLSTFHDISYDEASGRFSADIRLDYKGKPGMYYIFVWLRDSRTDKAVLAAMLTVGARR